MMHVKTVIVTAFSLLLLAAPARAEDNGGFGSAFFENRAPAALGEETAATEATAATLDALAPAAGTEADAEKTASDRGITAPDAEQIPVDQRAHEDNPDIVWP